jgi:ribosome-binding factor A
LNSSAEADYTMSQGFRPDRLADQIRVEITELLGREVHDPGIGFITLTRVTVTADLMYARAYYTTLGDEAQKKQTARALRRAAPFLRRQIAGRMRLRRMPELEFRFDESVGYQDRVEQIIQDIHAEDAARAAEAGPAEPVDHDSDGDE